MATFFGKQKRNEQTKLYKDILKDIKKIRSQDANNKYNDKVHSQESISRNLPQNLKQYSHTLHVVNEFWLNNIKYLNDEELNGTAMLLYCHLYSQCTPKSRELLLKSNKMNIPSHTLKIFTIFEYAIRQITDSNTDSHIKLFKQLKAIGVFHKKYLNVFDDIDCDIFELMLDSFNYCMEQKFQKSFSLQIRFCFNQFFRLIVDVMNDNNQCMSLHFKKIDTFLASLEDCLSDEYGSLYFSKFLQEKFCTENYLFYKAVQEYKSVKFNQRIKTGTDIINTFIKKDSENQVNVSASIRKHILSIVECDMENKQQLLQSSKQNNISIAEIVYCVGFTEQLFDKAQKEICNLMRRNSWNSFRDKILALCADVDAEFALQQETKLTENTYKEHERREFIAELIKTQLKHQKLDINAKVVEEKEDIDIRGKLVEELDKLKQDNEMLKANKNTLEKLKKDNEMLKVNKNELDKLKHDNELLKANKNELLGKLLDFETLENENKTLKKGISELVDNVQQIKQEETLNLQRNESIIHMLKQENDGLKANKNELLGKLSDLGMLQNENKTLKKEISGLRDNLQEIKQEEILNLEILKQSNANLQNENVNLQNSKKKLIQSKFTLIKSTSAEIDSLRTKIKIYTKQVAGTFFFDELP